MTTLTKIGTWKGKPVEELSHAELLEAFIWMADMYADAEKRAEKYLNLP